VVCQGSEGASYCGHFDTQGRAFFFLVSDANTPGLCGAMCIACGQARPLDAIIRRRVDRRRST
jgi:hypothetical protein